MVRPGDYARLPLDDRTVSLGRHQSLLASGGLTLAAAIWTSLIALVTVPVMVHGLGVTAYGIYSVAFSVAGLGSYLDLGLGWTTAKFVAEADASTVHARIGTVVAASAAYHLALGLAFAVIVIAASSSINTVVLQVPLDQADSANTVLRLTAMSFLASSLMGVFVSALRGLRRFSAATLIATGSTTISVIGAASAAAMGFGMVGAAAAQVFGVACGLVAAVGSCYTLLLAAEGGGAFWRQLRAMLGFSIWNYATRLIQMLVFQVDKILIARWLGPAALTFYSIPFNLAQRVNFLAGPAVTAIYPVAAVGRLDREQFMRQYLAASRLLHVATAALAISVLAWGDRFLGAWVGPEMASQGTFALRVLTVGFWVVSVGSFDGGCIEGWNRARMTFAISAMGATVGLVTAVAVLWLWTMNSAAAAIALGVAAHLVTAGLAQMAIWYRMSRYPASVMLWRAALPIAEMGLLAAIVSTVLRPVIEGRAVVMVTFAALIASLSIYGVLRAMSGDELRILGQRVMAPFRAA